MRGVNARAQTPDWMVERLTRAGQRSVTALVDISNYVMLLLGRPTHVFDLDRMPEQAIEVRWARAGESLTLLNEQTIMLDASMGVISSAGVPESLAGIMGGSSTAVSLDTKNIYVEAAFWWPEAIAGRARKLKLNSEASHRFERGVDFENIPEHLDLITQLILDICGGQAGPIDDQHVNLPKREPVTMRLSRCHRVLGVKVSQDEVAQTFKRLGFSFEIQGDHFVVSPPSYRFDIRIEEDLIEEVARIEGFESIPALPHLLNPIASQLAVMRSSLLPGLVANIRYNANRKQTRVRVFELGRVYVRDLSIKDGPLTVAAVRQPQYLAAAAWGPVTEDQWGTTSRDIDFFDVKRDLEVLFSAQTKQLRFIPAQHALLHPGRSARVELGTQTIGWLGELHPRWVQQQELSSAPVLFEVSLESLAALPMPLVQELSRQPMVQRDLAIWVSAEQSVQSLLDTIAHTVKSDPALAVVQHIGLFDLWRDPAKVATNEKSLAFRISLQDTDVTLDDAQVDLCMTKIRTALETTHQARPR